MLHRVRQSLWPLDSSFSFSGEPAVDGMIFLKDVFRDLQNVGLTSSRPETCFALFCYELLALANLDF